MRVLQYEYSFYKTQPSASSGTGFVVILEKGKRKKGEKSFDSQGRQLTVFVVNLKWMVHRIKRPTLILALNRERVQSVSYVSLFSRITSINSRTIVDMASS